MICQECKCSVYCLNPNYFLIFPHSQNNLCSRQNTTQGFPSGWSHIRTDLFSLDKMGDTKKRTKLFLCMGLPVLPLKTFILCLDYGVRFLSGQTKHTKCSTANWSNPELRRREAERNQLGDGSH